MLLAFGPSYLYFSRFAREDIYVAAITLALLVVIWRFLDKPRKFHPALIGAAARRSFATKETTFITVFVMGTFFLFALCDPRRGARRSGAPVRAAGWEGWGWCLAAFAGSSRSCSRRSSPTRAGSGTASTPASSTGSASTTSAAAASRESSTRVLLFTIEWPALLLGAIGAVALWRRNAVLRALPDLGLLRLAGRLLVGGREVRLARAAPAAAGRSCSPASGIAGDREARGALALARARGRGASALFYVGVSSWWVNVERGADPREFLVSTQSSTQVKDVADQVLALAESRGPGAPPLSVTVDSAEGATFPYAWYFRHLQTRLHRPPAGQRRAADRPT